VRRPIRDRSDAEELAQCSQQVPIAIRNPDLEHPTVPRCAVGKRSRLPSDAVTTFARNESAERVPDAIRECFQRVDWVEAMGLEPTNLLHAMQALYQLSYAPRGCHATSAHARFECFACRTHVRSLRGGYDNYERPRDARQ
jgi:hypothetical protein